MFSLFSTSRGFFSAKTKIIYVFYSRISLNIVFNLTIEIFEKGLKILEKNSISKSKVFLTKCRFKHKNMVKKWSMVKNVIFRNVVFIVFQKIIINVKSPKIFVFYCYLIV